jgi:superfamily I DNA/RNA helicase
MLAQRADFLLRTGQCAYPRRVLAISFKVDASQNLKHRVRQRCGAALASRLDSHTFHAFAKRLIDRFLPALSDANQLDADYAIGQQRFGTSQITFDDLVPFGIEILTACRAARNAVRQTYSHVFLDEFQDCTKAQYKLITAAFVGTNICLTAVGDTKQRIMGWAGALEGIFKTFASDFAARPLNLYQNFRSLPRLRRMQNAMVKEMEPSAAVDMAELQGDEGEIETLDFDDALAEASSLAGLIQTWISKDGIKPSEIAVLLSNQPDQYAQPLMRELATRGIAYRNEQALQDLAVEPVARLIVDFLAVVIGDREPDAYLRLMDVLGQVVFDDDATFLARAHWEQYLGSSRRAVRVRLNHPAGAKRLRELATTFLEHVGRPSLLALSAEYAQGSRLDDRIEDVFRRLAELLAEGNSVNDALARFSEDSAVRLMTIHKCKGLEFDSVIMLGVERESYFGQYEDERSKFFVGISRAKRRLLLTASQRRSRPEGFTKRWTEPRRRYEEFLRFARG